MGMKTAAKPIGTGTDFHWVQCSDAKCTRKHIEYKGIREHREKVAK